MLIPIRSGSLDNGNKIHVNKEKLIIFTHPGKSESYTHACPFNSGEYYWQITIIGIYEICYDFFYSIIEYSQ